MKNTFKKITAIAAVSLLAVSQVPAANILAKDGVATPHAAFCPCIHW